MMINMARQKDITYNGGSDISCDKHQNTFKINKQK